MDKNFDYYIQIYWGSECIKINDLVRIENDKEGSKLCVRIAEIFKDDKKSIKFKGDLLMSVKDEDRHEYWIKFDSHRREYIFDLNNIAGRYYWSDWCVTKITQSMST